MTTAKETEASKRKSPTYKLTIEQLTEQVKALETKDLQEIQKAISQELLSRKETLQKQLAELEGK
jgi:DNA-binding GntR family transcriptional regulator